MNNFCVYFHYIKNESCPFYIGIGSLKRPYDKRRSKFWNNIVNKYGQPIIKIIHENLSWDDACKLEIQYIKKYGRRDIGTGCLVNMTDGGDGSTGYKHNIDFINKMKHINRTNDWKNNIKKSLIGKSHSAERIENNRNSQIGLHSGYKNARSVFYTFLSPEMGKFEVFGNLKNFMKEHNLRSGFLKLCNGKIDEYKGWKLIDKYK